MTIPKHLRLKDNTILFVLFLLFLAVSIGRNYSNLQAVTGSDVEGYYMYLPAVLIQKDVHHITYHSMNYRTNDKGEIVLKYTCGLTFFYLPFFLAAHAYAHLFHYDTSGFSIPYYYGMIVCGVFWAFIGLYILRKLLLKYFSNTITWLTLLCIMVGTNFFHYSTKEVGMSHVYSFTLTATILLLTHYYYQNPGKRKAIAIGLLSGWLILIRPTNCVLIIFLLLFNVVTSDDLRKRLMFVKNNIASIGVSIPFLVIPFIPQLMYWKEVTGKWIYYSYTNERFIYWQHPKIVAVLFDTQNGLFLYSPILILFVIGLIMRRTDRRTNFWGVSIIFVLITYIFASWWAWWFGAAFGHRCYIEYLPVFAFPMAIALEQIMALKKGFLKMSAIAMIILLSYYSVRMSLLSDTLGIWDGPTWRWNWRGWLYLVHQIFR